MFEFLHLFSDFNCVVYIRMEDLSNPHCYARTRKDGRGVYACYADDAPPNIRRFGDDDSDADIDIDISDDDPEHWESRWFMGP